MCIKIFILIFLLFFSFKSFAADEDQVLNRAENNCFNTIFAEDEKEERLQRLELFMFGQTFNEQDSSRIKRISKIFSKENKIKLNEIENINKEHLYEANNFSEVSELEKSIFSHVYEEDDLYNRIERLEEKLFGATFPGESLIVRVNKLKNATYSNNYNNSDYSFNDNYCQNNQNLYAQQKLPPMNTSNGSNILNNVRNLLGNFAQVVGVQNRQQNHNFNSGFIMPAGYSESMHNAINTPLGSKSIMQNTNLGIGSSVQILD